LVAELSVWNCLDEHYEVSTTCVSGWVKHSASA
jgi:hypothetical protein